MIRAWCGRSGPHLHSRATRRPFFPLRVSADAGCEHGHELRRKVAALAVPASHLQPDFDREAVRIAGWTAEPGKEDTVGARRGRDRAVGFPLVQTPSSRSYGPPEGADATLGRAAVETARQPAARQKRARARHDECRREGIETHGQGGAVRHTTVADRKSVV